MDNKKDPKITPRKIVLDAWSALSDSRSEISELQRIFNLGLKTKNSFNPTLPLKYIKESVNSKKDFTTKPLQITSPLVKGMS
jgi:hypothetical protein